MLPLPSAPNSSHSIIHSPHYRLHQTLLSPGHRSIVCALCLGCFLQVLPVASAFPVLQAQLKSQLLRDLFSEHAIDSSPSQACFLPDTSNLQLFHLPACSLVYYLSPSSTIQITKTDCSSLDVQPQVQDPAKTYVCSMKAFQELRRGTLQALSVKQKLSSLFNQEGRLSLFF